MNINNSCFDKDKDSKYLGKSMIIIFALALFFTLALTQVSNTSYGVIIGGDDVSTVVIIDDECMQCGVDWLNKNGNGNGTIYLHDHNYNGKDPRNNSMGMSIGNHNNITVIGKHDKGTIISGEYTDHIFSVGIGGHLTLINITILNPSIINGPPIYNRLGTINLINCTIIGCKATIGGGVMYNILGAINIFNTTFNNNSATYGGVIYNNAGKVTINSSNFNNNAATYGGAIYNNNSGIIQINNSNITNGIASFAGAIYNAWYSYLNISSSIINNNSATTDGGAIYSYGDVFVYNSNITNNKVNGAGGFIYTEGNLYVNASNLINNYARLIGATIYHEGDSTTSSNISYSRIVDNNSSTSGSVISIYNDNYPYTNIIANHNWWGKNNPIKGVDYQGFKLDNWFVANLTTDPNITVTNGSNIQFYYDFYLSNSAGDRLVSDPMMLPYFDFAVTENESSNKTTRDTSIPDNNNLTINTSSSTTIINGIIDNQLFSIPLNSGYPDLGIMIKAPNKIIIGKNLPIKVIVTNKGKGNSINSIVKVKLPKGFKLNVTSLSSARYDPKSYSIIYDTGNLSSNTSKTLYFNGKFLKDTRIGNKEFTANVVGKLSIFRPSKLSQKTIFKASKIVKDHINKKGRDPDHVIMDNYKFSMEEFTYLVTKATVYKYENIKSDVTIKYNIKAPLKSIGVNIKGGFTKSNYYKVAKDIIAYISKHNQVPNQVPTSLGKMKYQTLVYAYSLIGDYTNTHNKLPGSTYINIKTTHSMNKYSPKHIRTDSNTQTTLKIKLTK